MYLTLHIIVTLKCGSEVTQGFLLVGHCKYSSILYHIRVFDVN